MVVLLSEVIAHTGSARHTSTYNDAHPAWELNIIKLYNCLKEKKSMVLFQMQKKISFDNLSKDLFP